MKKAFFSTLLVSSLAIASSSAFAEETQKDTQKETLNPWQDCGIGSAIFPESGTAAAISNIIWDLGTTAVSSNVSSQESCQSSKAKTAMFIQATLPTLEQDIATGEGEYVSAMLELRGCAVDSHQAIITAVREEQQAHSSETAEEMYNSVESVVTETFASSCARA